MGNVFYFFFLEESLRNGIIATNAASNDIAV